MNPNRLLLVLLLLLIVAAATLWALGWGGNEAGQLQGPASAPSAAPVATAPLPATPADAPTAADAALQRVEVPPDAKNGVASGPALIGQVVDEDGKPVRAAQIVCVPGMGIAPEWDSRDFQELAEDFDPATMAQRAQEQLQQRVEVRSDDDGRFRLVPPGADASLGLRVAARGFALLDKRARRPTASDTDLGALALQRGAIVQGRVADAQGNPIANATVVQPRGPEAKVLGNLDIDMPQDGPNAAYAAFEDSTVTDAAGRFELQHVEVGEFSLRVRHPDHPTARRDDLTASAGQTLTDVLVTLEPGASIRGRVVGAPSDVPGLRVLAKSVTPTADPTGPFGMLAAGELLGNEDLGFGFGERSVDVAADGAFALRGLHVGRSYRLWAVQTGTSLSGLVVCSRRLELPAGSTGVELKYETGVAVTFLAVDARTQQPIERLWVEGRLRGGDDFADMMQPSGLGVHARHYAGGRVTVPNLRPKAKQKLSLTVEATGFRRLQRESVELPASGNLDLGTLALEPAPVVHVNVVDASSGRPVSGASVQLQAPSSDTGPDLPVFSHGATAGRTDADGRCTLNAPAGSTSAVVAVSSKQHAPYSSDPIDTTAPDARHDVRLFRGGFVEVAVRAADGSPLHDANVVHRAPSAAPAEGGPEQSLVLAFGGADRRKTDANGVARFERLQPGEHAFRLGVAGADNPMAIAMAAARNRAGGDDGGWQTVAVADGATVTLQLQQQATATLHGIVRENGVPLSGATVAFLDGDAGDEREEMAMEMMSQFGGQRAGRNARSADDGAYKLADLPTGAHRLRITHGKRAMPATLAINLQTGDRQFDFDLDTTALRGIVRDPQGHVVAGATVRVRRAPKDDDDTPDIGEAVATMMPGFNLGGSGSKATTDADGSYELRGVDAGVKLLVRAEAKGLAPATSAPVEVERGSTKTGVDVALAAAGKIKVSIASSPGMVAVNATWAGDGKGVAPVMQLLRKGSGTLEGLRPGRWKVEVHGMGPGGGEWEPREVDVVAGETAVVEF